MAPMAVHHFAEKVALISDAASPVGRAVAMQLALQGCFVIGLFPSPDGGKEGSLDELVDLGTLAYAFDIDPSTEAGAAAAAAEVDHLFGRLDLLVNCLKFRSQSSFEQVAESDFLNIVLRNLGSVHFLTRAVFELMADRPKPKIVNLSTLDDDARNPVVAAAQAGIQGMTGTLARTLPANFRVNCVAVAEKTPVADGETFGVPPDEVARAVLFLLSSESAAMNGRIVTVG